METNDRKKFNEELNRLLMEESVRHMSVFAQHAGTNTLRHSYRVAQKSFDLAERFGWDIDEKELARGALLHDYYQYSIKEQGLTAYKHGTRHPQIAMEKADKDFNLTDKEKNIIRGHMWPLTFAHPPKSKEAILVSLADKDVAAREFVRPEIKRAGRIARKIRDRILDKN